MRTNIVLDDRLIAEAMKLTKARSKREAVDLALRELVYRRRRKNVLDLVGSDLIASDYDVRAVRAGMSRGSRRATPSKPMRPPPSSTCVAGSGGSPRAVRTTAWWPPSP